MQLHPYFDGVHCEVFARAQAPGAFIKAAAFANAKILRQPRGTKAVDHRGKERGWNRKVLRLRGPAYRWKTGRSLEL